MEGRQTPPSAAWASQPGPEEPAPADVEPEADLDATTTTTTAADVQPGGNGGAGTASQAPAFPIPSPGLGKSRVGAIEGRDREEGWFLLEEYAKAKEGKTKKEVPPAMINLKNMQQMVHWQDQAEEGRLQRPLKNVLPKGYPDIYPHGWCKEVVLKPGEIQLFQAGRARLERPNTMFPWQYAHLGMRFVWEVREDILTELNWHQDKPLMVLRVEHTYDPITKTLSFTHVDEGPRGWEVEPGVFWKKIAPPHHEWYTFRQETLEKQVKENIPGQLGWYPVIIPMPMIFRMEPYRYHGGKDFECFGKLLDFDTEWWYASTLARKEPNFYQWPWLHFWRRQVQYWSAQKREYPTLVALGPDMGVAVNRYLYKALAERDAHVWKYQGKYPDGYLGPEAEELQGQRAMWDYSPALKPHVFPPCPWNLGSPADTPGGSRPQGDDGGSNPKGQGLTLAPRFSRCGGHTLYELYSIQTI